MKQLVMQVKSQSAARKDGEELLQSLRANSTGLAAEF